MRKPMLVLWEDYTWRILFTEMFKQLINWYNQSRRMIDTSYLWGGRLHRPLRHWKMRLSRNCIDGLGKGRWDDI